MLTRNLAASCLSVKQNVTRGDFCHPFRVSSELQKLFARRLEEEMRARAMSAAALARVAKRMGYKISQTSVSNILRGDQDPTIEKIEAITEAIGVPAWFLLTEAGQVEQRVIRPVSAAVPNVVKLPNPYGPTFARQEDKKPEKARAHSRRKR